MYTTFEDSADGQ